MKLFEIQPLNRNVIITFPSDARILSLLLENRFDKTSQLRMKDVEQLIDLDVFHCLENDFLDESRVAYKLVCILQNYLRFLLIASQ